MPDLQQESFPRYEQFAPAVDVRCVTPGAGGTIHRFFDSSPFSPSGRYLGLTRLAAEDRLPEPGDLAQIVVVDLATVQERVVAQTRGWDMQLGAQVQWGRDDSQLLFNDLDVATWRPFGVSLDPATGRRRELAGTIYHVSPDGTRTASPCLRRIVHVQRGYGVVVPPQATPRNRGAAEDDGIYLTDLTSGHCRLLVSLAQIVRTATPALKMKRFAGGDFYAFHVKFSPTGDRLMLALAWSPRRRPGWLGRRVRRLLGIAPPPKRHRMLITLSADGTDVRLAVPAEAWARGGHHPNWCPDGEHILMNLNLGGERLKLVRVRYDGSHLAAMTDAVCGSGHPTLHPDGRHVLTDAYLNEPPAFGDGTVPIRWIDLADGSERTLVRIRTHPPHGGPKSTFRMDPHPAWDRAFRRVAFNACPDHTRRVYVADLGPLLH